jgi:membrane protein implicated in regulation of membrane protease activity
MSVRRVKLSGMAGPSSMRSSLFADIATRQFKWVAYFTLMVAAGMVGAGIAISGPIQIYVIAGAVALLGVVLTLLARRARRAHEFAVATDQERDRR